MILLIEISLGIFSAIVWCLALLGRRLPPQSGERTDGPLNEACEGCEWDFHGMRPIEISWMRWFVTWWICGLVLDVRCKSSPQLELVSNCGKASSAWLWSSTIREIQQTWQSRQVLEPFESQTGTGVSRQHLGLKPWKFLPWFAASPHPHSGSLKDGLDESKVNEEEHGLWQWPSESNGTPATLHDLCHRPDTMWNCHRDP